MSGPTTSRTIAVLTTGRQGWGILRSPCLAIGAEPGLRLVVVAGGMHLSGAHGHTIDVVRADGFDPQVLATWLALEEDAPVPPAADQAAGALAATGAWLREARARTRSCWPATGWRRSQPPLPPP